MSREKFLETMLDREDLTDEEFKLYNDEANQLVIAKEARKPLYQAKLEEEAKDLEYEKMLNLTEEQVDKMYEDTCLKYDGVNGASFKDWYAKSAKYYSIDGHNNVNARARSVNTIETIPHPTLAQARLTILKRIKYKFYDHAVRGHEFAWDIDDV